MCAAIFAVRALLLVASPRYLSTGIAPILRIVLVLLNHSLGRGRVTERNLVGIFFRLLGLFDSSGDLSLFLNLPRLSINCYTIVTLASIVSYHIHGSLDTAEFSSQSLPHWHPQYRVCAVFLIQAGGPHPLAADSIRHTYTHTPDHDGATNCPHDITKTGWRDVRDRYARGATIQRLR